VTTGGAESGQESLQPSISAAGRFVAFVSRSSLAPGDSIFADVYVRDRKTGRTMLISQGVGGEPGDFSGEEPAISGDGRYVAFLSFARNLVPDDTNGVQDIFVRDRKSGKLARVSVGPKAQQANDRSGSPATSLDGQVVGFDSFATNLVKSDTNEFEDVFIHRP
jgi:Tol biopolymer transport system component